MAEMLLPEDIDKLWQKIDQQHLGYLDSIEHRAEQRGRLENYMRRYLHMAPHSMKFNCLQTSEVLRRSVGSRDFSGHRAAKAWVALAKYAENIIRQPWRPEFREIKLYCGFYKHEIEKNLDGAIIILETMGYKRVDKCTMRLDHVIDPDQLMNVSKDAILAEIECQIMQKIWDALEKHRITWQDILEWRENYTGAPELAIKNLKFKLHEKLYREKYGQQQTRTSCYQGYYDMPPLPYSMSYSRPSQNCQRYAHIVSPQHIVSPTSHPFYYPYNPQPLKPHEFYPHNGYPPQYFPQQPHQTYNSYMHEHNPPIPPTYHHPHPKTSVPTAQLIEVESSVPLQYPTYPTRIPEPVHTELPSKRAQEDGAGSWESWNAVLRTAESEGYRKETSRDLSDPQLSDRLRGMNLASATLPTRRPEVKAVRSDGDGAARNLIHRNSMELEDGVTKLKSSRNSSERDLEINKNRKSKPLSLEISADLMVVNVKNEEAKGPAKDETDGTASSYDRQSPEKPLDVRRSVEQSPPALPAELTTSKVVTLDVSPSFLRDVSPINKPDPETTWECISCTYRNNERMNVCEMCNRSREWRDMKPLPTGGRNCPHCTLINERNKNYCQACGASLKDSSTYI